MDMRVVPCCVGTENGANIHRTFLAMGVVGGDSSSSHKNDHLSRECSDGCLTRFGISILPFDGATLS